MSLSSGVRLGPYEILDAIGAGGMGEVYRARDLVLKREVAIKVLPRLYSADPERLRRFQQEAEAAAALNHPNILSVYHIGEQGGSPYIVTELLEGESLRERLRNGALSISRATDYGIQFARGLSAAHGKRIVHRDLKPGNLFVTRDGRVKILDFGLAKLLQAEPESIGDAATIDPHSETGQVLGTVGYMGPEQVRGQAADQRSDIFAFGAILYEMLSGKRAFHGDSPADTMSAILNEDPVPLAQLSQKIPPALERVAKRCLEKNPEQRFQSASDLAFALEALSDSSASSMSAGAPQLGSIPNWIWIAITGIAISLATGFIALWRRPPEVPQIEEVTQLTDDGESKGVRLVTDGSRVYFNEGQSGSWRIAQVSVKGGQIAPVSMNLRSSEVADLSSDGSTLLVFEGGVNYSF